jgi:uncharacterized protein (DUF58 family)
MPRAGAGALAAAVRVSARIRGYGLLAGAGLIGALVAGRPEAVALVAPFALAVALGLVPLSRGEPAVAIEPERLQVAEGARATLHVEVATTAAEVELVLPAPAWVGAGRTLLHEAEPGRWAGEIVLEPRRWGAWRAGEAVVRTSRVLDLERVEQIVPVSVEMRVQPRLERLRRLVAPVRTGGGIGEWTAHAQRGDGIELAEVRPWTPGDPARRINRRASARRGELYVTDRHPERNATVVLLLDTFAEAHGGVSAGLDDAVRAASVLAAEHLRARDRVGLVSFGGVLHWLQPGSGLAHGTRIAEALIASELVFSYVWRDVEFVPARMLAPDALIVAVSPLLDERTTHALLQLRGRGRDLVIVEVSPEERIARSRAMDPLALRLWMAQRAALRARFARAGVALVRWDGGSLGPPLEEVMAWRRRARRQLRV